MTKKASQILQYLGTALVVISLFLKLAGDFSENTIVQKLTEHNDIFFWLGILLWAFGYMKVEQDKKKEKE